MLISADQTNRQNKFIQYYKTKERFTMIKTISIEGMHCQHCVASVKEALEAVNGVSLANVSLEKNNAVVEGENLNDIVLKTAIEDTGFDVISVK